MSKKKVAVVGKKQSSKSAVKWDFPLVKSNFLYFAGALGAIIAGYALMATGITSDPAKHLDTWANSWATVVAPAVLVVAYCVIIPLAIMKRDTSV
jgi:Protein of unknown function (DUF3098)